MQDEDESISQFVSITGSDAQKAKFYVDASRGDVSEAVSAYFEAEGGDGDGEGEAGQDHDIGAAAVNAATGAGTASSIPSGPRTLGGDPAPPMPEGWGTATASSSSSSRKRAAPNAASSGAGRFASLADMRSREADDEDDDERRGGDDDKDPLNFFTGGERSGLSVQNPNRNRGGDAPPGVVQDILRRAREMAQRRADGGGGDEDDDDEDWPQPTDRPNAAPKSFGGQGRTLGDGQGDSEAGQSGAERPSNIPGGFQLSGEGADADEVPDEIVNRRIIFWQDGFSLEDGPLLRYDDPQHAQTLAMINQGAAPLSFLNVRFGQRVNLTVEKREEKFKPPPPPPMKAFSGSGQRLGSPAPGLTSSSSASAQPVQAASTAAAGPPVAVQVDDSQPITQLQIRLADGQRLTGRFNQTHTVADVRRHIDVQGGSRSYTLHTSFPPKPITDEAQSLKSAGLLNAVVIQKWA